MLNGGSTPLYRPPRLAKRLSPPWVPARKFWPRQYLVSPIGPRAGHGVSFPPRTALPLAENPELFREDKARELEPNPASLSTAIGKGHTSFEEAGGTRAYFGWPADATAEEGKATIETLGGLLADAIVEEGA